MAMKGSVLKESEPALRHKIDTLLYRSPTHRTLRRKIIDLDQKKSERIHKGSALWGKFSDGFPNLMIKDVDCLRGRDCVVLIDLLDQSLIFEQFSFLYALPLYCCRSLTIVLPYFPTGTMDRVDQEGQVATAMSLARLFSQVPLTPRGPARLVIYDIHALQERFYFGNNVIPVLQKACPLLLDHLATTYSEADNITVAFPDDGACKRFGKEFDKKYPILTCSKVRDGDRRKVTVSEGIAAGRHCWIVDDIVKTGGTIVECKNALIAAGATKVSVFVTHGVFPEASWKKFIDAGFHSFLITDSCADMAQLLKDKEPFKVLSLAPLILGCIEQFKP